MEQFNNVLPVNGEGNRPSKADKINENDDLSLLNQVRQNFGFFGRISLIFGISFAFLFYKAEIGCNFLIFIITMIYLLTAISDKLNIPVKKAVKAYYAGTILLGLSSMLTSSENLQFINTIGMLLLFDLSLVWQFKGDNRSDFFADILRMFRLALKSIAAVGMPLIDCNRFLKKVKFLKNDKLRNTLIGVIIALPLLLIVSALLSSADMVFHRITAEIYHVIFSADLFGILLMLIAGFIFCYAVICGAAGNSAVKYRERVKADPQIAVTVTALLFIVYALFCTIQVIYLFNGGLFTLPGDFTYAQYARRGFFELLAVTCFNLVLILFCTGAFKESRLLRLFLTAVTITTYIMIASAAYRMLLYIGAYHLTFLRLIVLLFLLIDAVILAGIIIYIYNRRFPLFGFCVAVVSVCYLLFSYGRPDYFIASYNIRNTEMSDYSDIQFLTGELSYDAAPAVIPYLNKIKNTVIGQKGSAAGNDYEDWHSLKQSIEDYYNRINEKADERDFRDFNVSLSTASRYIKKYPIK